MKPGHDHIAHGAPAALREFAAESLDMARIQAELGSTFATIQDDVGLEYAVRRLVAYTRAALATVADLKATKNGSVSHDAP